MFAKRSGLCEAKVFCFEQVSFPQKNDIEKEKNKMSPECKSPRSMLSVAILHLPDYREQAFAAEKIRKIVTSLLSRLSYGVALHSASF